MEGEYSIYDGRNGELLWQSTFSSPIDQLTYPDGVDPAQILDELIEGGE